MRRLLSHIRLVWVLGAQIIWDRAEGSLRSELGWIFSRVWRFGLVFLIILIVCGGGYGISVLFDHFAVMAAHDSVAYAASRLVPWLWGTITALATVWLILIELREALQEWCAMRGERDAWFSRMRLTLRGGEKDAEGLLWWARAHLRAGCAMERTKWVTLAASDEGRTLAFQLFARGLVGDRK